MNAIPSAFADAVQQAPDAWRGFKGEGWRTSVAV
ncbi:MAG: hypothetical protein H6R04_1650, partial [Burkholderiaceae bacterium]|nr:hypothetical protein [Burkholderiaceae bacterium]